MTTAQKNIAQTIARRVYNRVPGQTKQSAFRKECKWFGVWDNLEVQDYALQILDRTSKEIQQRPAHKGPHPWYVMGLK